MWNRITLPGIPARVAVIVTIAAAIVALGGTSATGDTATTQPALGKEVTREAGRGPVKLSVTLDRDEVQIPGAITLTVNVEAEKGVEVSWPKIGETFGDFGVKATTDLAGSEDATTQRQTKTYTLEAFLPGTLSIPPIKVAFADRREKADGSKDVYEDSVETDAIKVTVRQNLADVKGPVNLPWPWSYKLLAWAAGLLAVVIVIAFLARWWLRKNAARRARPPRPIAAHEWALAELDMLAAEGLIERGRVQEFFYRINAIVRGYIERRWGLMAGEQTSEEFIRELQRSLFLEEAHKLFLRRFVDACDPVKYARQQPRADDISWVQSMARNFVLETAQRAPLPEAATEAVAA